VSKFRVALDSDQEVIRLKIVILRAHACLSYPLFERRNTRLSACLRTFFSHEFVNVFCLFNIHI